MDALSTNRRNGLIDIYRILFSFVIMIGHSVNVGMTPPFPFAGVGIFVEFFYLLTGYYTCIHYEKRNAKESSVWMSEALQYTYKKFTSYFPYLVISVVVRYLYDGICALRFQGGRAAIKSVIYMPFELFLTNYIFMETPQKVGALYFLASMIVVLPLFCVLCMCRNHSVKLGIAFYIIVFYYYDVDWAITAAYPQVLLRAFSGMCMGILIYYAQELIRAKKLSYRVNKICVVLGNTLLFTAILLSGLGINNRRIQLIGIFLGVFAITTMDMKYEISNKVTDYLARLSMVIYIFHWTIGVVVNGVMKAYDLTIKLLAYYVITIIVSVVMMEMVEKTKNMKKYNK